MINISKLTAPGLVIALTIIIACKSRVSEDFSLLADAEFSSVYESSKPRKCEASKATMFKNSTSELEKSITIKGNVTDIFKNAKPQFAVIMDHRASTDARRFIPVYIENRGNTRGTDCEIKPVWNQVYAPSLGCRTKCKARLETRQLESNRNYC